jgi:hypothetical protein
MNMISSKIAHPAEATTSPDAELIRICDEFCALERQINDFFSNGATPLEDDKARDAAQKPLQERQSALIPQIYDFRAKTVEGAIARGKAAIADYPELAEPGPGNVYEVILTALLRDLIGEARA